MSILKPKYVILHHVYFLIKGETSEILQVYYENICDAISIIQFLNEAERCFVI